MATILIDIDDTAYAFSERIHAACLQAGIAPQGSTITQWEFHNDYGIERGVLWSYIMELYKGGILMEPPYPATGWWLGKLRQAGHKVVIATARGFEPDLAQFVRAQTERWLWFYGIPHDGLHFTKDKATFARDVGVDYAIDDSVAHVEALTKAGVLAFLRDQPHNRSATHLDDVRVRSLKGFVNLILEVEATVRDVV